ncbi:MAG TPA: hypothetical protein DCS29_05025 [Candidatus Magasanikbacteria bacterium]|nr:hypothetical protein [Candidatus Magasanikbacteria bacterium]
MPKQLPLSQHLDTLRSEFRVMKECPLCETSFELDRIKVVDQKGGTHILHITCPSCKHAVVILVGVTEMGIGLVGLLSDLNYDDVRQFRSKRTITQDQLLEFYHILQSDHISLVNLLTI